MLSLQPSVHGRQSRNLDDDAQRLFEQLGEVAQERRSHRTSTWPPDWQVQSPELIVFPALPGSPGLTLNGECYPAHLLLSPDDAIE